MTEEQKQRAKDLVNEHWNYIEKLLRTHNETEEVINKIKFHYKTSGIHFYKHALEDINES